MFRPKIKMHKDLSKYTSIVEKFIKKFKNNKNVSAILLFGSYVNSEMDKNSDLDFYIILKNSAKRERGNTWIDGVEVEYLKNPVSQIRKYLLKEEKSNKYSTANILTNSIILYKKDNSINKLIKSAKIIFKKNKKISKTEIEIYKYKLNDLQNDLEDVYLKNDVLNFKIIENQIFDESIKIFRRIKNIKIDKNKLFVSEIKSKNPNFYKLLSKSAKETNINKRFKNTNKIINYIENELGGKRSREWKLVSDCK